MSNACKSNEAGVYSKVPISAYKREQNGKNQNKGKKIKTGQIEE